MDDIKFTVTYKGKTYEYNFVSEVYIFHAGVYNNMDKKYSKKALLEYVHLVHTSYLADINRTPLGAFANYVARNWKRVNKLDRYELLEKFYMEEF